MKKILYFVVLAIAMAGWRQDAVAAGMRPVMAFPAVLEELVIEGSSQRHLFHVELAQDEATHERGLMFRRQLAADHGMLFDFGRPRPVAMWMRHTYIPLDILFIDAAGRVTKIHPDAKPFDETPIESDGPALAVLELPGGTAARLGLRVGDRLHHPLFPVD